MSNNTGYKPHPLDVISHAQHKIDLIYPFKESLKVY
jgi:hypothetical protein